MVCDKILLSPWPDLLHHAIAKSMQAVVGTQANILNDGMKAFYFLSRVF